MKKVKKKKVKRSYFICSTLICINIVYCGPESVYIHIRVLVVYDLCRVSCQRFMGLISCF